MAKHHIGLVGLLVVQLLLAGGLYWQDQQSRAQVVAHSLLDFDREAINKLVITDGAESTTLQKIAGQWQLPDMHSLPVAETKISEQLDKLQAAKVRWPVARTSSSRQRFEVADDKFQRKLQVFAGDKPVGEILLGTSPGFRKVHVRRAGENEIYYVELNTYELPVAATEWLDTSLLAAREPEKIQGPDYVLHKSGDQWTLGSEAADNKTEASESLKVDGQKAEELAATLSNLSVTGVASVAPEAEPFVLNVKSKGQEWRYEFIAADDKYYVKRNDQAQVFILSQQDYDRVTQIRQPQLAVKPQGQEGEKEENKSNG